MKLREYQEKLIIDIKTQLKNKLKKICIQSACGSGKSVIQGMIAASATKKGNRVLFLVHRKELVEQIKSTFVKCKVDFNLCNVGMVQTICRNLDKQPLPDIIITDENHHCLAKSYTKIYDAFPNAILLGFTATPIRLGGKGLHPVYNKMVHGPDVNWLIENKFLSPYRLYSKKLVDTKNLHIRNGDYKQEEVNELMEDNCVYGDTIKNYKELADGKKTIVYCSSIKSSISTSESFIEAGYKSKHLDGTTSSKERDEAIKDFRDGKINILCNVDLFGEGFDVPDCECVILLRPTKSLSLYIQQSMRSMRYKEGKEAIIIDHVGNCFEHNLPDYNFNWSLEDHKKAKKSNDDNEEKIKECPQCFSICKPHHKECPYCGYIFIAKEKKEKKVIDMNLLEITPENILRNKPHDYYKKLRTLKELIIFAKVKKYKLGWLNFKMDELKSQLYMTFNDLIEIQKENKYKFAWVIHKATEYNIDIPHEYNKYRRYTNERIKTSNSSM